MTEVGIPIPEIAEGKHGFLHTLSLGSGRDEAQKKNDPAGEAGSWRRSKTSGLDYGI